MKMEQWCPGIHSLSESELRVRLHDKNRRVSLELWREFGTLSIPKIQLLHEMGFIQEELCCCAARAGNIPALEYFLETASEEDKRYVQNAAAHAGQLETLIWLVDRGWELTVYTSRTAAGEGHLHILQYLHEHQCPFDEEACRRAIHNNHLHVIEFLKRNKYPLCGCI